MAALAEALQALENAEHAAAALTRLDERDEAIHRLIAAIEQDRAELLAAIIGGQAVSREPRRIRSRGAGL